MSTVLVMLILMAAFMFSPGQPSAEEIQVNGAPEAAAVAAPAADAEKGGGCMPDGSCCGKGACARAAAAAETGDTKVASTCPCGKAKQVQPPSDQ
jgi:hypothetical protein